MGDAFRRRSSQHHATEPTDDIAGAPTSYAPGGTTSEGNLISGAVWPHGSSAAQSILHATQAAVCRDERQLASLGRQTYRTFQ